MAPNQFIFTLFCTIAFCLGLRIITDKGQLLYFLRKPFDSMVDRIESNKQRIEALRQFNPANIAIKELEKQNKSYKKILYAMKPVLLCITCLASIWGVSVFIYLNGIHTRLIGEMLMSSISSAFVQTFIWNLYEKHL